MRTQTRLFARYINTSGEGEVRWIGVRPERRAPMQVLESTVALAGKGLQGDRQGLKQTGSKRQVTLINQEDILALAVLMKKELIDPSLLRRNIVVSGINLHSLRYQRLQIGQVIVELGAHCHPCNRMEQALGQGGFMNMYGHAGYCAEVIEGGDIRVGDSIRVLPGDQSDAPRQAVLNLD